MKIIAMKEQGEGNAEVGSMWIDTAIFAPTATLMDVITWAQNLQPAHDNPTKHGRLMLSIADERRSNDEHGE